MLHHYLYVKKTLNVTICKLDCGRHVEIKLEFLQSGMRSIKCVTLKFKTHFEYTQLVICTAILIEFLVKSALNNYIHYYFMYKCGMLNVKYDM